MATRSDSGVGAWLVILAVGWLHVQHHEAQLSNFSARILKYPEIV
jgi:hypothetical protein